jgi:hypothetical protein
VPRLPGAAFVTDDVETITGPIAIGTRGADGNVWKSAR